MIKINLFETFLNWKISFKIYFTWIYCFQLGIYWQHAILIAIVYYWYVKDKNIRWMSTIQSEKAMHKFVPYTEIVNNIN